MKLAYQISILLVSMSLIACTPYSFSPSGKSAFKSVHIAQIENQTIQYEMADRLTDAIIDAFVQDNTVEVLDVSRAEAVMTGSVTNYRRDAHTFDLQDVVTEYAVKVTVHVKVVKANSEEIIWEEDFYAEGIFDANEELEEDGQNRAIELIKINILDKTTKSW